MMSLCGINRSEERLRAARGILDSLGKNIDDIYWNYFNKAVKITLTNKVIKYGIIIKEIIDKSIVTQRNPGSRTYVRSQL